MVVAFECACVVVFIVTVMVNACVWYLVVVSVSLFSCVCWGKCVSVHVSVV